jgi:tRNA(Ile)-lysidine synthase
VSVDLDDLLGRCTFPGAPADVSCAVSGGADSLALLVLACRAGLNVTAVHVDHGLRPGSAREAEVVADAARRFGASFRAETIAVAAGPNLEARLRTARYAALPPGVLTGHTADDQAETVLLNLLRGAGWRGLAGMGRASHPILGLRRCETAALCAAVGLDPVHDPSNDSLEHRRNRVRHELLPLASDIAERDVAAVIARSALVVAEDDALLDQLAGEIDPTDTVALLAAPRALARRALRQWLTPHLGGYPPDAAALERVLQVVGGQRRACEVAGGLRIERSARRLSLQPAAGSSPAR